MGAHKNMGWNDVEHITHDFTVTLVKLELDEGIAMFQLWQDLKSYYDQPMGRQNDTATRGDIDE